MQAMWQDPATSIPSRGTAGVAMSATSSSVPDGERSTQASIAVLESWARTQDRSARTWPAREKQRRNYLERAAELHPDGTPEVIEQSADALYRADQKRRGLKSAKVRRARAEAKAASKKLKAEAADLEARAEELGAQAQSLRAEADDRDAPCDGATGDQDAA